MLIARVLAALAVISSSCEVRAKEVELIVVPLPGIFEFAPNGTMSGAGSAMLTRLTEISALKIKLVPMPAPRALLTVKRLPATCVLPMPRLADREADLRWLGELMVSSMSVFGRHDDKRQISAPEQLRGSKLVVLRTSLPAAWAQERYFDAQEVSDVVTAVRMLRAGRVDYWVANDRSAQHAQQQMPGPPLRMVASFGRLDSYLACHRDIDAEVAADLTSALQQLRREGLLAGFGMR